MQCVWCILKLKIPLTGGLAYVRGWTRHAWWHGAHSNSMKWPLSSPPVIMRVNFSQTKIRGSIVYT